MLKQVRILLLISVCLLMAGTALAIEKVGRLKILNSDFEVLRGSQVLSPTEGMPLFSGDQIETFAEGRVKIMLNSGDELFLAPNSKLTLKQERNKNAMQTVGSIFGKFRARVKRGNLSGLVTRTPTATMGVKGTDFVVEYRGQESKVSTLEGLVYLRSNKSGMLVDVPAGKEGRVSAMGEVLPLREAAGDVLSGVEVGGKPLSNEEMGGAKISI